MPDYGYEHKQLRAQWKPKVEAGIVDCWRCGEVIIPGTAWDLGHADDDPSKYGGPEHAGQCNRSAGGKRGAAVYHAKQDTVRREW